MWVLVQINIPSLERQGSCSSHGRPLSSALGLHPCFSVLGRNRDPANRVLFAACLFLSAVPMPTGGLCNVPRSQPRGVRGSGWVARQGQAQAARHQGRPPWLKRSPGLRYTVRWVSARQTGASMMPCGPSTQPWSGSPQAPRAPLPRAVRLFTPNSSTRPAVSEIHPPESWSTYSSVPTSFLSVPLGGTSCCCVLLCVGTRRSCPPACSIL